MEEQAPLTLSKHRSDFILSNVFVVSRKDFSLLFLCVSIDLPLLSNRHICHLLCLAFRAYHTEFITKWRQLRLDVILCPVLGPASSHSYAGKLFGNVP